MCRTGQLTTLYSLGTLAPESGRGFVRTHGFLAATGGSFLTQLDLWAAPHSALADHGPAGFSHITEDAHYSGWEGIRGVGMG